MTTASPATDLLTSLLRHHLADLGTCQVVPHWAQVLACSRGGQGNLMHTIVTPR